MEFWKLCSYVSHVSVVSFTKDGDAFWLLARCSAVEIDQLQLFLLLLVYRLRDMALTLYVWSDRYVLPATNHRP